MLGVPAESDGIDNWTRAATIVETYRLEHGITDKRTALGLQPRDPIDGWVWQQARWDIDALIEPPAPKQTLHPVTRERDLGIGLGL
jgi:hypothetical protein